MKFLKSITTKKFVNGFASYAFIIALSIIINTIGYFVSMRVIEREVEKSTSAAVENVKNVYDNYLEELTHTAYNILNSKTVEKMVSQSFTNDYERTQTAMSIMKDMNNAIYNQRVISNCVIIMKDSDTCISNNFIASKGLMYDTYFKSFYESEDKWLNDIYAVNINEFKVMKNTGGKNSICFFMAVPYKNSDRFMFIEVGSVPEVLLRELNAKNDGAFYITDRDGNILYDTGKEELSSINLKKGIQDISGERYAVSVAESKFLNLSYVYTVPNNIYLRKIRTVRTVFIIGYLLCVLVCGALGVLFSKVHEKNRQKMLKNIERLKRNMRDSLLMQIFESDIPLDTADLKKNNLILNSGIIYIIGIDYDEEREKSDFDICRFLEKAFFDAGITAYFCIIQRSCCGIICGESSVTENEIRRITESVYQSLLKQGIHTFCAVSGPVEEYSMAGDGYNEVIDVLNTAVGGDEKRILFCSDLIKKETEYKYNTEISNRLINLIMLAKKEELYEAVDELFEYNMNEKHISPRTLKLLLSEIGTTLMKAEVQLAKGEELSFKGFYTFFVQVNNIKNYKNAKDIVLYYTDRLCELSMKNMIKADDISVKSKCDKIVSYVEENYQNYDLNVNHIADKLEVTPNWLSKYFKDKMGLGLSEYILKYRIEKAKELLNPEYSIASVAQMCGFTTDGIFRRAFKKYEGITPTQYRQLKDKNQK